MGCSTVRWSGYKMRPARSLLLSCALLGGGLAASAPTAASAYESVTTEAGLTQQAALASRLHRRLLQRFVYPLGLFEPLRLDLSTVPPARARALYGRLVGLDPAQGYAPEWQAEVGRVHPFGRQHVLGWLAAGTVIESVPAERMRNHFFDPRSGAGLRNPDGQSASDSSLTAVQNGLSSVRQLLAGAAVDGTGMAAPDWVAAPEATNEFGLASFLRSYERAVVAELPEQRESALAEALLSAGAMLGVLEQMGDPAYLQSTLTAALDDRGAAAVAERFGRAGVPAAATGPAPLPGQLRDLFSDGQGGGLAERTARRCTSPLRCYTTAAPALLAEVAGYGQRLIDYLFRGELHLALAEGEPRLDVVAVELPLGSGTVTLLGEQPEGRRRILRKVDTVPALAGATVVQLPISEAERRDLHRLVVLFHGRDRLNQPLVTSAQIVLPHAAAAEAPAAPSQP